MRKRSFIDYLIAVATTEVTTTVELIAAMAAAAAGGVSVLRVLALWAVVMAAATAAAEDNAVGDNGFVDVDDLSEVEAFSGPYNGEYTGECTKVGFFYVDTLTFVICDGEWEYVNPCTIGMQSLPASAYKAGAEYSSADFCNQVIGAVGNKMRASGKSGPRAGDVFVGDMPEPDMEVAGMAYPVLPEDAKMGPNGYSKYHQLLYPEQQNSYQQQQTYDTPKYEEPKYEEPKYEAPKYEAPKYEEPKYEEPKYEAPKYEAPKYEEPKYEEPKYEAPRYQAPKYEAPKYEAPKYEAPKYEPPKYEAPKYEAPKYEPPKYEAPKYEAPKYEAPKTHVGVYSGKCTTDGLFYNDEKSFVLCSNGFAHVQYCAPGTKNDRKETYAKGYGYQTFCGVNLVDSGYTEDRIKQAHKHKPSYKPVEKPSYKPVHKPSYKPVEKPSYKPVETYKPVATYKPEHKPTSYKPEQKPTYPPHQPSYYEPVLTYVYPARKKNLLDILPRRYDPRPVIELPGIYSVRVHKKRPRRH